MGWLAPKEWIAKVLGFPLVNFLAAGLVYLEAFLLDRRLGRIWQVAVAVAALIAVSIYHAVTILLLLLPLRIVGAFVVDSVLGGERWIDLPVNRWPRLDASAESTIRGSGECET